MPPEIPGPKNVTILMRSADKAQTPHVMRHRSNPLTVFQDSEVPVAEEEINTYFVNVFMNDVNAVNAARIYSVIDEEPLLDSMTDAERKSFSVLLDDGAKHGMEDDLHTGSFITRIKGCEGAKEEENYGPSARVSLLDGHYGLGDYVSFEDRHKLEDFDSHHKVEIVLDPIEGTKNAASGKPGAISITAGILDGEISRIPSEKEARYMDRIIASPRVRSMRERGVSIDASVEHNVRTVMRAYGLSRASDVEVVVLNRDRNGVMISELQRLGVNLRLIDGGDLLPALAALTSDKPIISMGKGGKEEAVITALAAFAAGGVFEGKYVDKVGDPVNSRFGQRLKLENLISGNRSNAFLSFASITGTIGIKDINDNLIDLGPIGLLPVYKTLDDRLNIAVASISGETGQLKKSVVKV